MRSCSDTSLCGKLGPHRCVSYTEFLKVILRRTQIEHHVFSSTCSSAAAFASPHSSPFLFVLALLLHSSQAKGNGLRLPPHFNGRNALVLDTSPSPSLKTLSPCLPLPPRASHSLPSLPRTPHLPISLTVSPSPLPSPPPRLLHPLPISSHRLLHPHSHPSSYHPH